jgi:hypothetical protein
MPRAHRACGLWTDATTLVATDCHASDLCGRGKETDTRKLFTYEMLALNSAGVTRGKPSSFPYLGPPPGSPHSAPDPNRGCAGAASPPKWHRDSFSFSDRSPMSLGG